MMDDSRHFERLYRADPDPWRLASDWYERRKRSLMLASLPREHYAHGFEPGCGNGETTARLLQRCDRLCAVDFSRSAVRLCLERVGAVEPERLDCLALSIPAQWPQVPAGGFDLVVVSELLYYFGDRALDRFIHRCLTSLAAGGNLIMCHSRRDFDDRRQSTDRVHQLMARRTELTGLFSHVEADFRIDGWEKRPTGADA